MMLCKKTKNILSIVPSNALSGGAEKNLSHILKAYAERGYNVLLIIWNLDGSKVRQWQNLYCYDFYEISERGYKGLIHLVSILRDLSKNRIDCTLISNITLASIVGLLRKLHIYKTNMFIVRDPSSPFLRYSSRFKLFTYKLRYRLGYGAVDYLIFQTSRIKDAFYKNTPFDIPCKVIGNPINLEEIRSKAVECVPEISNQYILACGRLIPEKGFDLLINAFNALSLESRYKLIILGDGPLREELNIQIQELNLSEYISLLGFVENPMPYFKNAKVCVISSRAEGFPNVLYQMMALNSKVLMTKCCGDLDDIPAVHFIDANSSTALEQGLKVVLSPNYSPVNESLKEDFLKSKSIENYMNEFFKITDNERN